MTKDTSGRTVDEHSGAVEVGESPESLLPATDGEAREVWRVVSADGSTQIFQTKPASESRRGKRTPVRRATPCALDLDDVSATATFFAARPELGAPVVSEAGATLAGAIEADLSAELTSVTQAWPSLSPGIRGAVMALIRAASTGRSARPSAATLRE